MINSNQHFSIKLRVALIALAVFLLQWNVPVYTAFQSSWSADICVNKLEQPIEPPLKTWQNFQLLACAAQNRLSEISRKFIQPKRSFEITAKTSKKTTAKSFKIVKVASKKTSSSSFCWPVMGRISSGFGMRRHPVTYRRSFHNGIDIKAQRGTVVSAPVDGVVVSAGRAGLLGRMVKIQTSKGLNLYFGHLEKISCKKGQKISRGQLIGTVGSSGRATGPHLHFSVKSSGSYLNPMNYLPSR